MCVYIYVCTRIHIIIIKRLLLLVYRMSVKRRIDLNRLTKIYK